MKFYVRGLCHNSLYAGLLRSCLVKQDHGLNRPSTLNRHNSRDFYCRQFFILLSVFLFSGTCGVCTQTVPCLVVFSLERHFSVQRREKTVKAKREKDKKKKPLMRLFLFGGSESSVSEPFSKSSKERLFAPFLKLK